VRSDPNEKIIPTGLPLITVYYCPAQSGPRTQETLACARLSNFIVLPRWDREGILSRTVIKVEIAIPGGSSTRTVKPQIAPAECQLPVSA
jgi:hypothetical protein